MVMIAKEDGGDGLAYHWMKQEDDYSCAAATLSMILWMKKGKFIREDQARLLIEHAYARNEGNTARASRYPVDWTRSGVSPHVLLAAAQIGLSMSHQFGRKLVEVKTEIQSNMTEKYRSKEALIKVAPNNPGIIGIKRPDGWHAAVAANIVNNNLIVLDPAFGIALVKKDAWDLSFYEPEGRGPEDKGDIDFCILFPN
jgi:hypothetical protein